MSDFEGRVILITGAGKGLGRAYALWLAKRGATVIVNNRIHPDTPSSAQAVVDEITASGGKAIADHHSVQDEKASAEMIEEAFRRFGRIDALVCNAGISVDTPFQDSNLDKVREVMDINIWGSVYPVHATLPKMLEAGYGRIILTTSQAGLFGQTGGTPYSCSKAAMIGLARGIARDVGNDPDIRINLIAPAAYTPMASKNVAAKWAEYMSPFKVAPVVGWLCGETCRESGMIFNVGGGRMSRVKVLESRPVDIIDEDVDSCLSILEKMEEPIEATSSFGSGQRLLPELFAADPDMVDKR